MATLSESAVFDDNDDDCDYYDLTPEEEALLCQLDTQISPQPSKSSGANPSTDSALFESPRNNVSATASPEDSSGIRKPGPPQGPSDADANASVPGDVLYPDLTDALSTLPAPAKSADLPYEKPGSDVSPDEPSPLARFRMFPKKPFSVTDLTSGGAWCELQYYYTLTRLPLGKKTRTAVMKAGSKVHKKLENEVHTTVKVDVVSKEDIFGLKLWNVIQGLRTLRDTGLTREMEVWGMVDGHLVTGVIDSLSYTCPNTKFEELLSSQKSHEGGKAEPAKKARTIYLSDVKTRGVKKPPTDAVMLRPTKVQLFLYHRFLSEMIAGKLDFFRVFRRLDIDADEPFSDEFIAQVGSLHDDVFYDAGADASQASSDQDSTPDLIKYKCLRELLELLKEELRLTFSDGTASLGQLVSVDYRYREDGSIIGTNTFPVDDEALTLHLESDMEWWKGERKPRGVDIEEAFKCRMCEFAGECEWREQMEAEMLRKAREKIAAAGGIH